jgi:hypothetical protein
MLQLASTRKKSSCNWSEIKSRRVTHTSDPSAAFPYDASLIALLAADHGLATIAFCFGVDTSWVLARVAALGLVTPHMRAMRRPGGQNPWTSEQTQQLILLWPTNLYATCIAEKIGRTPASVRYKARWLGLTSRDRSTLVRVAQPGVLPPSPRPPRQGWTVPDGHVVGYRYLRAQHTAGIAKFMGRSFNSVSSRACQIGLPGRHSLGDLLKMDHNASDPVLEKFAKDDWTYRQCNLNPENWFWAPRMGARTAPATKNSKLYKDRVASGDDSTDIDFDDK